MTIYKKPAVVIVSAINREKSILLDLSSLVPYLGFLWNMYTGDSGLLCCCKEFANIIIIAEVPNGAEVRVVNKALVKTASLSEVPPTIEEIVRKKRTPIITVALTWRSVRPSIIVKYAKPF